MYGNQGGGRLIYITQAECRNLRTNMFVFIHELTAKYYTPAAQKCKDLFSILGIIILILMIFLTLALFAVPRSQKVHVVMIIENEETRVLNAKFLSLTLDTSVIASGFKNFNPSNVKLIHLMKALSPGYLRIGGTMGDRLYFSPTPELHFKHDITVPDGGECAWRNSDCNELQKPNFTMNDREWLLLNNMANQANYEIIFGLNSLRRFDNGSWDYRNAEQLIKFSQENNLDLHWELGNEPNAFRHQFNYSVSPEQMAKDFHRLREILETYPKYTWSLLAGPDVTRPQANHKESEEYLNTFVINGASVIDAVTFHQYYLNGRTAEVKDFLDPEVLDLLKWQVRQIKFILLENGINKPIWLGETSSAYGGGAVNISDRFASTFMWLDKIGICMKLGVDVIMRQSIWGSNYSLLDHKYNPNPDFWVTLLYKTLVAPREVKCYMGDFNRVRIYCQCARKQSYVTIYGMNLNRRSAKVRIAGLYPLMNLKNTTIMVDAYVLTTNHSFISKDIFLNGIKLQLNNRHELPQLKPKPVPLNPYLEMPAFSLAFWVIPGGNATTIC